MAAVSGKSDRSHRRRSSRRRSSRRRRRSSPGRSSASHSRSRRSSPHRSSSRRRHSSPTRHADPVFNSARPVSGMRPYAPHAGGLSYGAATNADVLRVSGNVAMGSLSAYDTHDRAPEDARTTAQRAITGTTQDFFANTSCIVRGSLAVNGVNYSTYEAHMKLSPQHCDHFLDGVRDDIVSEVGNGLRRGDILFKVYPGAVRSLVLKYDDNMPKPVRADSPDWQKGEDPTLLDADWSMKVDYAIRARNPQRQQRIAAALFHALGSEAGLQSRKTKDEYVKWLDPDHGKERNITIKRTETAAPGLFAKSMHNAQWDADALGLPMPPAPAVVRAPSPVRPGLGVPVLPGPVLRSRSPIANAAVRDLVGAASGPGGAVFEPAEMDGRKGIAVFIPEETFTPGPRLL